MRDVTKLYEEDACFIEYLYNEFGKLMFTVARRFTIERMDLEDVVSTTLMALMNNTQTLQALSYEDQKAYIARAVIATSISFLRKCRAKHNKEISIDSLGGQTADTKTGNTEDMILLSSELEMVIRTIMQLPDNERRCLQLRYLQNRNNEEIAAITGLSVNSIPQYIKRARTHLRIMYAVKEGESR